MRRYWAVGGLGVLLVTAMLAVWGTANSEPTNGLTPVSAFTHAHGLALDVADPLKLYIATHEGLYLLSNDKDLYRVGKTRDDLMGFSIDANTPGTFYSSGHPSRGGNIGFQKTEDGGLTWQRVSLGLGGPVDFHAMTVSPADSNVAYGYFSGRLQRTADGGESWEYATGEISPIALVSHPALVSVLYAATPSGVQVSEDRGDTWRSLSSQLDGGAATALAIDGSDTTTLLVFSETMGGLAKSSDGGRTWRSLPERFSGSVVLYLAISKSQQGTAYALTESNAIYKTSNGGDSWTQLR